MDQSTCLTSPFQNYEGRRGSDYVEENQKLRHFTYFTEN
jgi:hypothetical protein